MGAIDPRESWLQQSQDRKGIGMTIGSKSFLLVLLAALSGACGGGPKAVRGSDVAGLDDEAMGTGLDRRDLQWCCGGTAALLAQQEQCGDECEHEHRE